MPTKNYGRSPSRKALGNGLSSSSLRRGLPFLAGVLIVANSLPVSAGEIGSLASAQGAAAGDAVYYSDVDNTAPLASLGSNLTLGDEEKRFYRRADEYLKNLFQFNPSMATQVGVHDFDASLEDVSAAARAKEDEFSRVSLKVFEGLSAEKMSLAAQDDLELVKNHIKSSLFDSQVLEDWKRNPDRYSSFVAATLFPLLKRDFAPLDERVRSVIEREKQMPQFLADGRRNIEAAAVPRVFAELADEQLPGIIGFFKDDVPAIVKDAKSESLKEEFAKTNQLVIDSLTDYQKFVKGLLSDANACKGDYALGAENFAKVLQLQQMVDEPLDVLLKRGEQELARLQKEFKETATAMDPKASQAELFDSISINHPQSDKLLHSVKDVLARIRSYIIEKKIVTIPGADNFIVEDTPPFMRATTVAAMEAPGPIELKAKEAFYFVTLPDASWDKKHVEEHMRAYSFPDILCTSIHEAYPGHYVQALWNKRLSTNVRRVFDCSSNAEGWAHYCEQMMLEQGFDKGDKQLRLIQIHDALLRCCRYIVAIKMHTQGMTVAQATEFFMREGFQEKANGEREAKRGTEDPTYLVYTLGKLEILSLKDQVRQAQGKAFDLEKFHDAFLSIGGPPLKIVKAEMLAKMGIKSIK